MSNISIRGLVRPLVRSPVAKHLDLSIYHLNEFPDQISYDSEFAFRKHFMVRTDRQANLEEPTLKAVIVNTALLIESESLTHNFFSSLSLYQFFTVVLPHEIIIQFVLCQRHKIISFRFIIFTINRFFHIHTPMLLNLVGILAFCSSAYSTTAGILSISGQ